MGDIVAALNLAEGTWAIGPLLGAVIGMIALLDKITGIRGEVKKARHTIANVLAEKRARATVIFLIHSTRLDPEDIGEVAVNQGEGGGRQQLALDFWAKIDAIDRKARLGEKRCSRCLRVKTFLPLGAIIGALSMILVGWIFPDLRRIILLTGSGYALVVLALMIWLVVRLSGLDDLEHDAAFGNP